MIARHIVAEVQDEVTKIVLFLRADGAVGEAHVMAATDDTADGVIGVDPGVDAGRGAEFSARRPELDGIDGR